MHRRQYEPPTFNVHRSRMYQGKIFGSRLKLYYIGEGYTKMPVTGTVTIYLPWPPWVMRHRYDCFYFLPRHPRWPMQVLFHVAVANSFAYKLCQCKRSLVIYFKTIKFVEFDHLAKGQSYWSDFQIIWISQIYCSYWSYAHIIFPLGLFGQGISIRIPQWLDGARTPLRTPNVRQKFDCFRNTIQQFWQQMYSPK